MDLILHVLVRTVSSTLLPYLSELVQGHLDSGTRSLTSPEYGMEQRRAVSLWNILEPRLEDNTGANTREQIVSYNAYSATGSEVLTEQIRALLANDPTLVRDVTRVLDRSRIGQSGIIASGERSVAVGGEVTGSVVVTGDGNRIPSLA